MRLLPAILLIGCANAQLLKDFNPDIPQGKPVDALPSQRQAAGLGPVDEGEVLISRLQQIHLLCPACEDAEEVAGGIFTCPDLLLPSPRTLASRLTAWLGQPLTDQGLGALGDLILAHYDAEGYPVVMVDAPEQDLSTGKLEILIEVGTIGRVGLSRPKYGRSELLAVGLKLQTGETLRRGELEEQLDWYGRTPFRRPRLFVSPGATPASADLLIGLEERRPWRVYAGYENSGPDLLGKDRYRIGAAGMLPGEQLLGWQSVLGGPVSSLQAHALHWEIPIHRHHHLLRLDGAFAKVESRYLSGGLPVENSGTSWALTALYQMPLPSKGGWRHHLAAGAEVKGTDQFLLFGGGPISPGDVIFVHGKLEYTLARTWENAGLRLVGTVLAAPGGRWPNHPTSSAGSAVRPGGRRVPTGNCGSAPPARSPTAGCCPPSNSPPEVTPPSAASASGRSSLTTAGRAVLKCSARGSKPSRCSTCACSPSSTMPGSRTAAARANHSPVPASA